MVKFTTLSIDRKDFDRFNKAKLQVQVLKGRHFMSSAEFFSYLLNLYFNVSKECKDDEILNYINRID